MGDEERYEIHVDAPTDDVSRLAEEIRQVEEIIQRLPSMAEAQARQIVAPLMPEELQHLPTEMMLSAGIQMGFMDIEELRRLQQHLAGGEAAEVGAQFGRHYRPLLEQYAAVQAGYISPEETLYQEQVRAAIRYHAAEPWTPEIGRIRRAMYEYQQAQTPEAQAARETQERMGWEWTPWGHREATTGHFISQAAYEQAYRETLDPDWAVRREERAAIAEGRAVPWSPAISRQREELEREAARAQQEFWSYAQGLPTTGAAFAHELMQADVSGMLLTGAAFGQQGVQAFGRWQQARQAVAAAQTAGIEVPAGEAVAAGAGPVALGVAAVVAAEVVLIAAIRKGFEEGAQQAQPAVSLAMATSMDLASAHQITMMGRVYGFDPQRAFGRFFMPEQIEAVFGAAGVPLTRTADDTINWMQAVRDVRQEYRGLSTDAEQIALLTRLFGDEWRNVRAIMEHPEALEATERLMQRMGLSEEELQRLQEAQWQTRALGEAWSVTWARMGEQMQPVLEGLLVLANQLMEVPGLVRALGTTIAGAATGIGVGIAPPVWAFQLGMPALLAREVAALRGLWGRDGGDGAGVRTGAPHEDAEGVGVIPRGVGWSGNPRQELGTIRVEAADNLWELIAQQWGDEAFRLVTR